jgi:hypothetical protein
MPPCPLFLLGGIPHKLYHLGQSGATDILISASLAAKTTGKSHRTLLFFFLSFFCCFFFCSSLFPSHLCALSLSLPSHFSSPFLPFPFFFLSFLPSFLPFKSRYFSIVFYWLLHIQEEICSDPYHYSSVANMLFINDYF